MKAATSFLALLAASTLGLASGCGSPHPAASRQGAGAADRGGTSPQAAPVDGESGLAPGSPTPAGGGSTDQSATGVSPAHSAPATIATPRTTSVQGDHPAAPPPSSDAGSCPDPRYCATYVVYGGSWATDAQGRMLPVPFRINPAPPPTSPGLTADEVERAILAAVATWEAADPQVDLAYQGRTTDVPGGFNGVIGFAPAGNGAGISDGPASDCNGCAHPQYTTFDIRLDSSHQWADTPCDPAHGMPCTPTGGSFEVQEVATHEIGHVLGLDHPPAISENSRLTMYWQDCAGCRWKETLGLGDVLGVRSLYPTRAAMPPLYAT
jgi:hypothetical protein